METITTIDKKTQTIIIMLVTTVMFMEFLDVSIINTAIPSIAKSFQEDPLLLKYSVTSYFLSLAIFIPMSGWCADKFGTKKVYLFSVGLFTLASFFCGISHNIVQLTIARFFQGAGGSFMNPVSRIIILRLFQPKDLVKVQGYVFAPAMLGFILGPFLGGLISTYCSWHWIFFINIPVGILAILYAIKYIPQQMETNIKKFDWISFALSCLSLAPISFAIETIGHNEILSTEKNTLLGFFGFSVFIILLIYSLRIPNPMLDFTLFRIRTFRIGLFSNLTSYFIVASISFLLPLLFQEQFGYSPIHSGVLLLPIAFANLLFRTMAPKIIHCLGFKKSMLWTICLVSISLFLLSFIQTHWPTWYIIAIEFFYGSAFIINLSSTGALNYIHIPKNLSGKATALDLTSRQFVSCLGVAITAMLIQFFRDYYSTEIFSPEGIKIFQRTLFVLAVIGSLSIFQAMSLKNDEGRDALTNK